jgi:GLPGLI family protein
MKLFYCILFVLLSSSANSQMNEGYIQFNIDVEAKDTSLKARQTATMLRDSRMQIYFATDLLRIDYKMGKLSDVKMIIDYKINKALTLMKSPYGKFAKITAADELEYQKSDDSSTIVLYDDTKIVLGYECKKAILTTAGKETTYWYTNEINVNFNGQQFFGEKIPGFPMIFSIIDDGIQISYQVSNIETSVKDKETIFSTIPPEDYPLMSE